MIILLVEDNELNRDMLEQRLLRKGFTLVTAVDGQEAFTMAKSVQPDIILMDMSLPVIDGWMATQWLKNCPETAHLPIIALTAHAMAGDREKAFAVGCDGYVTKPIDFSDLLAKIETLGPLSKSC